MSVILPNVAADPKDIRGPLLFFMGPVGGGEDWQYEAYKKFDEELDGELCAAIPCRYEHVHPLMALRLPSSGHFARQLQWERYYLEEAGIHHARHGKKGCIVCWCPCESKTAPRADGNSYAMDTRGEIGEWRGRLMYDTRIHFVIGVDPGFPGRDVIVRNFEKAIDRFKVFSSLDEIVEATLKILRKDS